MKTVNEIPVLAIRPAHPEDASLAAELIHLSMGGLADLLFGREQNHPTDEVLANLFVRTDGRLSHRFATVAEVSCQVAGLLLSYPAAPMPWLDFVTGRHLLSIFGLGGMIRLLRRLLQFKSEHEAERSEYYISNLAVLPRFQGKKVGTQLLAYAEKEARAAGLKKCSLLVDVDNHDALRLYERTGYRIVLTKRFSRPVDGDNGYHRMVKFLV